MILNSLQLNNYKQYGTLQLEFREGLVGIIGKNGAGKSTIFEAILYCLYGKDELNNKELIRSAFSEPKVPVVLALTFSIGEARYTVRRELRGRKLDTVVAELYKNDNLVAKGANPVTDEVTRLLKLDRDAFKRSVFSGQKELTELSDTKGITRARMVRKMLGLENLDEIQTEVSADIRSLRTQISGQEQLLLKQEELQQIQETITRLTAELGNKQATHQAEKDKLSEIETQFKLKKEKFEAAAQKLARFNELNRQLTQLNERLAGAKSQETQVKNKIQHLEQQKAALRAEANNFSHYTEDQQRYEFLEKERLRKINKDAYSGQLEALREPQQQSLERIAELGAQLAQLPVLEQNLADLQKQTQELRVERENKRTEHQQYSHAISTLEERIRERREKVAHLQAIGKNGNCPTCFQPVRDAYDDVLLQLQSEIDRIEQNERQNLQLAQKQVLEAGLNIKAKLDDLIQQTEKLQAERSRLQELDRQKKTEEKNLQSFEAKLHRLQVILNDIGEIQFDAEEHLRLSEILKELTPRFRKFQEEQNYIAREMPLTTADLKKIENTISDTVQKTAEANETIRQLKYDEALYQSAKSDFSSFDETLKTQNTVVQTLLTATMQLQNDINRNLEKTSQHDRVKLQIAGKQQEIEVLEKLAELLRQFKLEILERVSPGISREASALFSRITKGKYESIRVDENFEFSIADGGIYYPIERFSGGEIDLANFCLRIAITKAIMELSGAGQAVEFLAFDEIFGSQDEERRHEMMLALNFLQEQFRQIYIVSHIETQKDYFPHILEVKNTDTGSRVRWV